MKRAIIVTFIVCASFWTYSNSITNVKVKNIDRNGYTSTSLYSSQIYNLWIEIDYYNSQSTTIDDYVTVRIAGYGAGDNGPGEWLHKIPNIKPGHNQYSIRIKSLSSDIASYFPANVYVLYMKSTYGAYYMGNFTISQSTNYASTNQNTNSNSSYSSSSSSGSSISAGAAIAAIGVGLLAAALTDDNKKDVDNDSKENDVYLFDNYGNINGYIQKNNVVITACYVSHKKTQRSDNSWVYWDRAVMNIYNRNNYPVKVVFKAKLNNGTTRTSSYIILDPNEKTEHYAYFGYNKIIGIDIQSVERYYP